MAGPGRIALSNVFPSKTNISLIIKQDQDSSFNIHNYTTMADLQGRSSNVRCRVIYKKTGKSPIQLQEAVDDTTTGGNIDLQIMTLSLRHKKTA